MKRAVIFLNGTRPSEKRVFEIVKTTDTIICADGGIKHAFFFGLIPSIVIGDFDSTPKSLQAKLAKQHIPLLTFPTNKDETDSELTIAYIAKKGFKDIIVFAADGDRTDHVIANMLFFATCTTLRIQIVKEKEDVFFVSQKIVLTGKKGDTVSLIPLTGDVKGVSTTGLKWKLREDVLVFGKTKGVSNEMTAGRAVISVTKGTLLVVQSK